MQTYSRRDFLAAAGAGTLGWLCAHTGAARAQAPAARPNIVIVLSDDMGFSDIGCYGSEIPTPNLDQLAGGGLRFTQFYNTARCCPTRASLLTGLYPHQAAIGHMVEAHPDLDGYAGDLSRRAVTIAEALKPAGYASYAVGKWHVTPYRPDFQHNWPLQRGFERYYGTILGAGNYFDPSSLTRDNTPITAANDPAYQPKEPYYYTDAISAHATRFISDHAQKKAGQPFFLYVAYTAAHWPLHAPEGEIARFKGKYADGYEPVRRARFAREQQLGLINPKWDLSEQAGDWGQVVHKDWEARCMEVYAAQVSRLDRGVGDIVAALREHKLLENTLFFFLQDNGACAEQIGRKNANGEKPLAMPGPKDTHIAYGQGWANVSNTPFRYYKHFVHEGGISTPLIAHWPAGIARRGELEHQPGHLVDLMATCVELAGAKYPAEFAGEKVQALEGCSLAPAFAGQKLARANALFWEHEGNRAIRQDQWKLVAKGPQGAWELYDMAADRTEMHDLAAQMPDKVKALTALWEDYARRTHAIPWPWGAPYGQPGAGGKNKKKQKNA
jgi:arylsulfatase